MSKCDRHCLVTQTLPSHTQGQRSAKLALWSEESPQIEKKAQGSKVLLESDLPFCKRNLEKFSLGRTHTHTHIHSHTHSLTPLTNQCWDLLCKVKTEFWVSFSSVKMSVFSLFFFFPAAVQFVLSLLEPEPAKRPTVKAAMEDKWLNEGYAKRPLHTVTHKNRYLQNEI